MPYLLGLNIF